MIRLRFRIPVVGTEPPPLDCSRCCRNGVLQVRPHLLRNVHVQFWIGPQAARYGFNVVLNPAHQAVFPIRRVLTAPENSTHSAVRLASSATPLRVIR